MATREKTGGRAKGVPNRKPAARGAAAPPPAEAEFLPSSARPGARGAAKQSAAAKLLRYRSAPIDTLVPYAANARTHSPAQVAQIAASIREFGFTNPVLTDGKRGIIAGHGRVLAAQELGMTEVPVIELSHLTAAQRRAYVIADNQLTLNAGWDNELLALELGELREGGFDLSLLGFGVDELAGLLGDGGDGLTDPDDVPDVPADPVTWLGDVWSLGAHRLVCGDCTDAGVVETAMGGAVAQMVFTDPPYGVDYTGGMKKRVALAGDHVGTDIYAASLIHLAFAADDEAPLYLWYADGHAAAAAAAAAGYQIVAQIIWAKNHAQFVTSARYKGKHEPCFYAHRAGKSARWHGPNNEVTLWECNRSPRKDFHPTQKPVELAERAITNSTAPGDRVLDLFLGGGTTIIAAEKTDRACHAVEIAPAYVDVAVRRWQAFTGQTATLATDGRSFAEIEAERGAAPSVKPKPKHAPSGQAAAGAKAPKPGRSAPPSPNA